MVRPSNKKIFQVNIPYRAILPEKLDGLAVIGIAASAHRDALPIMRMQSDVQNTGYAAGRAAAMSAKSGKPLRGIDVKELQRHLAAIGSIPQEALQWDDGFTVDAERWNLAVRNAGDGYKDVPLLLTDVDRALPPLRAAYVAETNPTRKLCYAHILGIMGDATGAETLARQIDGRDEPIKINVLEQTAYGPVLAVRSVHWRWNRCFTSLKKSMERVRRLMFGRWHWLAKPSATQNWLLLWRRR